MPRGRKKPPQESVDSILLAMSRRDDLDPDVLSHYLDRLDEEWTAGAREKVLHLFRSNDASAHSAAALILSELATDFDLDELEDLVTDPTISDMAKLTLVPILKELDSEMADEGIMDYLNDPESAMLQMQTRLLELIGQSELGIESVLEDVLDMPMDRRLGFIGWLGMSQDPRAALLLLPLLENQPGKVTLAVIEALEQLGPVAAHHSIPALNRLLASSSNRQVKQQARAALGRLTMQSAPGTEDAVMESVNLARQQPLYEARVSLVDGAGAQMILLSWQRPDGLLKGVNVLYQDQWGIKDCYGTDEMVIERWEELVESMEEEGFISFLAPMSYCNALIAEARGVSKRTRHKIPVAYAVWRPFIEATSDDPQERHADIILPARPFSADVAEMAQRGFELYSMQEFNSWYFDPFSSVASYVLPYINAQNTTGKPTRGRKRKIPVTSPTAPSTQAEQETIVTEALEKVVDAPWRELFDSRLRRQAALFMVANRVPDARLVSAVASMLHPSSGIPPQQQPFLRAMMHRTLEGGLLRMMTEAMESGPLKGFPFDLLKHEDDWGF